MDFFSSNLKTDSSSPESESSTPESVATTTGAIPETYAPARYKSRMILESGSTTEEPHSSAKMYTADGQTLTDKWEPMPITKKQLINGGVFILIAALLFLATLLFPTYKSLIFLFVAAFGAFGLFDLVRGLIGLRPAKNDHKTL